MRLWLVTTILAGAAVATNACSTETTRTSDVVEAMDDSEAAEAEAEAPANAAAELSDEDRTVLAALEENVRSLYAQRYSEVRQFDVQPQGSGRYGGPVRLFDVLLDRETEVDCQFEISGGQITAGDCDDIDPVAARSRTIRGDVRIRPDRDEEAEIIREMQYNLAGQNRTNEPIQFNRDGQNFVSLFRTSSPDRSESWQSGCAGQIEQSDNGLLVTYLCRQRP